MRRSSTFVLTVLLASASLSVLAQAPPTPSRLRVVDQPAPPPPPPLAGAHAHYDALVARPEMRYAYSMRSQAELDAMRTGGDTAGTKRLPVTYDPVMDAALFRFIASNSSDSQQKILPITVGPGSMFLTWDFRFNEAFAYKGDGYLGTHKAWRMDHVDAAWISMKVDYQSAAATARRPRRGLAEFYMSSQSRDWLGQGTSRDGELLLPRKAEFFIQADTWTRVFFLLEKIGEPESAISVWIADETRDAVQLYDRLAYKTLPDGPNNFRHEFDSSRTAANPALNPGEMRHHARNFVVLHNVRDVQSLLRRPAR
jgi:hypothetical protein